MPSAEQLLERTKMNTENKRLHPYPFVRSRSTDETDFTTANDVVPLCVPLEKVCVGSWTYTAKDISDIEFLYELESSALVIKADVGGTNNGEPGVFRITQVSAADLALVSVVPGSLESMVARLILETEEDIIFKPTVPREMSSDSSENDHMKAANECRIMTITASVHESGHLRDVLLFLKSNYASRALGPDSIFLSPHRDDKAKNGENRVSCDSSTEEETAPKPQVTFLEGLPFWVSYIPRQVYSKRARIIIQWVILFYSVFSVIWACWQLYRHVNVIRYVIQPIISLIKPYLSFLFDWFDYCFAVFTEAWQKFLSPLNILRGILATPLFGTLLQLKGVFAPLAIAITQCLNSSGLVAALKALSLFLWYILSILRKPFSIIWNAILNSRIAVASLDLPRLQLQWVCTVIMNSFRAISFGVARLLGYARREHKKHKAIKDLSNTPEKVARSPSLTPTGQQFRQRMPVYYSSPLARNS